MSLSSLPSTDYFFFFKLVKNFLAFFPEKCQMLHVLLGHITLKALLKTNLHTILLWNLAGYWTKIATWQKSCCHHASMQTVDESPYCLKPSVSYPCSFIQTACLPILSSDQAQAPGVVEYVQRNSVKALLHCTVNSAGAQLGALERSPSLGPPWQ